MRHYLLLITVLFSLSLFSADIYFNPVDGLGIPLAEGSWETSSNWSYTENGATCNRVPAAGDHVIIPENKTANITSQIDLTREPCSATIIDVYGDLFFESGKKLRMGCDESSCGSYVMVHENGSVTPEKTNGNSNYIEICTKIVWSASDGVATGPMTISPVPLPVDFLSLDSENVDNTSLLQWSTASELNNDVFIIEHSLDGVSFKVLDFVEGNGNVNYTIDYEYKHSTPAKGTNYYRLLQRDYDGTTYELAITKVNHDLLKAQDFKIYPNPLNKGEVLNLDNPFREGQLTVDVYNTQSQLVYKNVKFDSTDKIRIEDLQLKHGIYHVVITSELESYSERLIVQ
jgi:hypothetical protein